MNTAMMAAALLLVTSGITQAAQAAAKAAMDSVSEHLAVETKGDKVLVTLTVDNRSAHTIYLPKVVAEDTELFGPYFEVRSGGPAGAALDYIGPKVKRAPFGKDDFVALKARSKHRHTIDIGRAFAFLPGQHVYQLSHGAGFVSDLRQVEATTPVEVVAVNFTYARP